MTLSSAHLPSKTSMLPFLQKPLSHDTCPHLSLDMPESFFPLISLVLLCQSLALNLIWHFVVTLDLLSLQLKQCSIVQALLHKWFRKHRKHLHNRHSDKFHRYRIRVVQRTGLIHKTMFPKYLIVSECFLLQNSFLPFIYLFWLRRDPRVIWWGGWRGWNEMCGKGGWGREGVL